MKDNKAIDIVVVTSALWCGTVAGVVSSKKMLELAREVNLTSAASFGAVVSIASLVTYSTFNGAYYAMSYGGFKSPRETIYAGAASLALVSVFTKTVSEALKDRVFQILNS